MLKLKFTLDGKITSVNKIYLKGRYGGTYLAPEVKEYRKEVKPIVERFYKECPHKYEGGLLIVVVDVHYRFFTKGGDVYRIDIDNFAKQIIDSIFPPMKLDDSLIFDLRLRKVNYAGNPKITVSIKEKPSSDKKSRQKL